jgi:hypothetical protein
LAWLAPLIQRTGLILRSFQQMLVRGAYSGMGRFAGSLSVCLSPHCWLPEQRRSMSGAAEARSWLSSPVTWSPRSRTPDPSGDAGLTRALRPHAPGQDEARFHNDVLP